jgi:hypothetical protein
MRQPRRARLPPAAAGRDAQSRSVVKNLPKKSGGWGIMGERSSPIIPQTPFTGGKEWP